MVRLLHTADWHIGRSIRGRSRAAEFEEVLDEVVRIAVDERVDAVLVAGDVYDGRIPPPEADAQFFETCLRLREAEIPLVGIAGNHDAAARLEAFGKVLPAIGARLVATVRRPEAGGIVEIPARDGSDAALVACVPFVAERHYGHAAELFDDMAAWKAGYAEGIGRLLAAMAGGFRLDRVNVILAHLFTDGALLGGGEREVTIGLDYAVSPARLPSSASYVALGHVHRPQAVAGAPAPTRYAGSLLQLDFGEGGEAKSVTLVEARPGRPARVREIPLTAGRRLVDIRGRLEAVIEAGRTAGSAWLRIFVETDGPVPGIADIVRAELPNALDVKLVYERTGDEGGADHAPVGSLAPREQFLVYERQAHGAEPDPSLVAAFDEVLAAVRDGEERGIA